ncbi:MAG: class I SAM-dependent methyltransferase [Lachnospiraceae bacterium]|nr:class I SAM-dependent methyltransferase [Lachnospiraceae bacterium]
MQLSKRLLAVAGMVSQGGILADIGTDHAYIPIYLVEKNLVSGAIAADVNPGPLARAAEHIREHGLEFRIETRLSDGLSALEAGEAESIVIAGMGGALTIRILREGFDRLNDHTELILQPQSEIPQVRTYLLQNGFCIIQEDMVLEEGKYYPMMKAARLPAARQSESQEFFAGDELALTFGPKLLQMRHPVLYQFLLRERATQERILESLKQGKDEAAKARAEEVHHRIELTNNALDLYAMEVDDGE